jgi:hypothetical protein
MGQDKAIKNEKKKPFQQEISPEFNNYKAKMNLIKDKNWKEISLDEKRSMASQFFISTTKNPLEMTNLIMEKPELRLGWPGRIFQNIENNRHDNLLWNVYVASLIFIGEVTSVEIIKREPIFANRESVLYKYGFKINKNINPIATYSEGDNISFYFPTGSRIFYDDDLEYSALVKGSSYMVLLTTLLLDYKVPDGEKLPTLGTTTGGSEGFEIENNNSINDKHNFFSEKNVISIDEAPKILIETINELKQLGGENEN